MDQEPHTVVGRYELIEKIAEGGMGRVYRARHIRLDEPRVLKTLRSEITSSDEHRRRFEREVAILRELGHPQIVRAYDSALEADGTAFLVLEYVDGITLDELVTRRLTPSLGLAVEIAHQALEALAFIHGRGVVHRDIAADNLMLAATETGAPVVKLLDLGIATRAGSTSQQLTNAGTFLGKIRYTAPEQFASGGATNLDQRSDLYSFGVLFYQLLTGHCPILGSTFSEVSSHHLFKPPLPFASSDPTGRVPEEVRRLALSCLEKTVEARLPSAVVLQDHLAPWREDPQRFADETTYLIARIRADREQPAEPEGTGSSIALSVRLAEVFPADRPEPPPLEVAAGERAEPAPPAPEAAVASPPSQAPEGRETKPFQPLPAPARAAEPPPIVIPKPVATPSVEPTRARGSLPTWSRTPRRASVGQWLRARWLWWSLLALAIAVLWFAARARAEERGGELPVRAGHSTESIDQEAR